jgi:hypothetical protein
MVSIVVYTSVKVMKRKRDRFQILIAGICLAVSIAAVNSYVIGEYNRQAREAQERANHRVNGGLVIYADFFGINYAQRNRTFVLCFCTIAFAVSFWQRGRWVILAAYVLCFLLIYQWLDWVNEGLSMNDLYMAESPYLLRLASTADWTLFIVLASSFLLLILRSFRNPRKIAESQA